MRGASLSGIVCPVTRLKELARYRGVSLNLLVPFGSGSPHSCGRFWTGATARSARERGAVHGPSATSRSKPLSVAAFSRWVRRPTASPTSAQSLPQPRDADAYELGTRLLVEELGGPLIALLPGCGPVPQVPLHALALAVERSRSRLDQPWMVQVDDSALNTGAIRVVRNGEIERPASGLRQGGIRADVNFSAAGDSDDILVQKVHGPRHVASAPSHRKGWSRFAESQVSDDGQGR